MTDPERFIAVVMSSRTADAAARKLGISRDAVLQKLRRWRRLGVKGLPDLRSRPRRIDANEIQALVNKYLKARGERHTQPRK